MTLRTYRVSGRGRQILVYDPCSGVTRLAPHPVPAGRRQLDEAEVRAWPAGHPAGLGLDIPVSLCWSPLVRCNLDCPHCLDDKSVPELDVESKDARTPSMFSTRASRAAGPPRETPTSAASATLRAR